ncbi:MAG: hypothetical protein JNL69_09315 [Bacteroidia bacterium]|nr:hypothetical protein [Bacteroidia bacterium]
MKQISINEYLNSNNPWSKRLLGLTQFQKKRDTQQIENEYNLDKYGKLLEFDFKTIEEYKSKEFELAGLNPISGEMIISIEDDLFKASVSEARKMYYDLIKSLVSKYKSKNICELGCGYGYNLSLLDINGYGGEYSINAVKLAKKLGLDVTEFNYYNEADYNFIKPDSTIFTAHSIEQIPDATIIIDSLEKQKNKINYIINIEPTVIEGRNSFLGLLRNKYMELNDYNRNLLCILQNRKDIEILELNIDSFGLVPLNTANTIVWRFKK